MSAPLRLLLPAIPGFEKRQPSTPKENQPKRQKVSSACEACRLHKSKCSAEQPICTACSKRNTVCQWPQTEARKVKQSYKDLRERNNEYEDLIRLLMELPDDESLDVLRHMKAKLNSGSNTASSQANTESSSENSAHVKRQRTLKRKATQSEGTLSELRICRMLTSTRSLLRTPSINRTNMGLLPPMNTAIEFELVALHPKAYPSLIPLDVASVDLSLLGISPLTYFGRTRPITRSKGSDNTRAEARVWPSQSLPLGRITASNQKQQVASSVSSTTDGNPVLNKAVTSEVGNLVDARLAHVRLRQWTGIHINDATAAKAISLCLEKDSAWWGLPSLDLFLDDLVSGGTRFCSKLLVNCLLAWSFQAHAYFDPGVIASIPKFVEEASRLYDEEKAFDSLNTLAATTLLFQACFLLENDVLAKQLLADNAAMATRLQLYNVIPGSQPSPLDLQDEDVKAAAATAAWASFNFQILVSLTWRVEPRATIPPTLPIPGDLLAPGSLGRPLPPYQGPAYAHVCKLWAIASEMSNLYFREGTMLLTNAEAIFQKLLAWADSLRQDSIRGKQYDDRVTGLDAWFHAVILDLFLPFAYLEPQPKLTTFSETAPTPAKVIEASIKQLKRIVYDHRATSKSANYGITYQVAMLHVLNHILHDYSSKEAHFYFLLCMRGYQNLARSIPLFGGIVQGISAMAVQIGTILPADALKLFEEIKAEMQLIQQVRSTYCIDLHRPYEDTDKATVQHLMDEFKALEVTGGGEQQTSNKWGEDPVEKFTTLLHDEQTRPSTCKLLENIVTQAAATLTLRQGRWIFMNFHVDQGQGARF